MASMVEDLLDVTRIRQADGLGLHPVPAHMDSLVQRALDELRAGFPERSLQSELEGDVNGVWDVERIGQVLSNLIGNAVHHGDPDQPVHVARRWHPVEHQWCSRSSMAAPFPPTCFRICFVPFRRQARPSGRHQGLGLGLFIADKIVRLHGGSIEVSSFDATTRFSNPVAPGGTPERERPRLGPRTGQRHHRAHCSRSPAVARVLPVRKA